MVGVFALFHFLDMDFSNAHIRLMYIRTYPYIPKAAKASVAKFAYAFNSRRKQRKSKKGSPIAFTRFF